MKINLVLYPLLIISFVFFNNCQKLPEKDFYFNASSSKQYQFKLSSENINLEYEVTCNFDKDSNDEILMSTVINKIQYLGESDLDKEMNKEYQNYINSKSLTTFDKHGKSIIEKNSNYSVMNPELFVVEFPKKKIKVGDNWNGKKSAEPDFIFNTIKVNYKLVKIEDNNNIIEVKMYFGKKENTDSMNESMTKTYIGEYVVNNDGTVKNAKLNISGFSGFSNISGNIIIQEIK